MKRLLFSALLLVPLTGTFGADSATPVLSTGNTAWVMISAALVMFMTVPALAMFYGGLVRRKNVLSILMQSFATLAVVSLLWVTVGYSLTFSHTELIPGVLGDFRYLFLNGITPGELSPFFVSDPAGRIPHLVFVLFQAMFAVITPALIVSAFAERIRFSAFLLFIVLWSLLVYAPIAHMVWSPSGFFYKMGVLDFAGGHPVEIASGFSALAAALYMGKRKNFKPVPPHDMTFVLFGAGMLWFGWFGFNAGSALAADGIAAQAFLTTNTAGAAAALTWAALDWILTRRPTLLGAASGAIAGQVVITPAAGFVDLGGAFALGLAAGLACYFAVVILKNRLGYDDSLDAFGVHGVAGLLGTLGLGLLANPAIFSGKGLFFGNPGQFGVQALSAGTTVLWTFGATWLILFFINRFMDIRVPEREEAMGLDISQHNERAYTIIE